MRQFFIWLLSPVARYFSGVHPNLLTLLSCLCGIISGIFFSLTIYDSGYYLIAGCFAVLSGLADSLDGIVARMYDRCSKFGDFLDHFCDRIVDTVMLTGLAFSANATPVLGLMALVSVLLNTYLGTQIHASFGKRYYWYGGKAEGLIGLVILSFWLWLYPETGVVSTGGYFSLINIIFILLIPFTLGHIILSIRKVYQLTQGNVEK